MNPRGALAVLALCLVSAAAGFTAYRWWQAGQIEATAARPDLQFHDLDGQAHRLSRWDGKLVLLNFWATWCTPCLKEIPLLVKAQEQYAARGLQIVGLALDKPDLVRPYAARLAINYPVMVGEVEIVTAMDALGDTLGALPFSVLISRDGRIIDRVYGDLDEKELGDLLDGHL